MPNAERAAKVAAAMNKAFGEDFLFVARKQAEDVDLPRVADASRPEFTVQGVFTQTSPHYDQAISLLARDSAKFTRLHTHAFPLERAADAIETLAGERAAENAICVSLSP